MDALTRLNENFLSCNICTGIFNDPCTLGCQHTFCRICLTKYAKTRRDAIHARSIECPNCRQMTKVPRPQAPVDQWCNQFKPSFLIQELLDSFTSKGSLDPVEHCCFTCQHIGKTSQAKSVCEDCDIMFCEACAQIHVAAPNGRNHVISPLGAGSATQLRNRKAMCKEHDCQVEFCCKECQKAVCNKCCIVYHRACLSVHTLESMIPEMKQELQQHCDKMNSFLGEKGNNLKSRRSEIADVIQRKSSLLAEIRRVSQEAVDLIRRKEQQLLDELDTLAEQQTQELRVLVQIGETDLQTYQQYTEFIRQVLHSDSLTDLYDIYRLCQSGEITAEIQKQNKETHTRQRIEFVNQMNVGQIDRILNLWHLKYVEEKSKNEGKWGFIRKALPLVRFVTKPTVQSTTKGLSAISVKPKDDQIAQDQYDIGLIVDVEGSTPQSPSKISCRSTDDRTAPNPCDIEVFNIDGIETLLVGDIDNSSVKSCYTKGGRLHCISLKLDKAPFTLAKISKDQAAIALWSDSIKIIKLTPAPVLLSSFKTEKKYRCLTALNDRTLAAGCFDHPSIDILDLSGRVLRSVITPNTGQQLILRPTNMCSTSQGHIVVVEAVSGSAYYVTQRGEVLYRHKLTGGFIACGGVTTTDTGSVLVADFNGNKIVQLAETWEYVRDLLTDRDGIVEPQGIRVYGNKLYVTEFGKEHVKIFKV